MDNRIIRMELSCMESKKTEEANHRKEPNQPIITHVSSKSTDQQFFYEDIETFQERNEWQRITITCCK